MKYLYLSLCALSAILALGSCKTSEANYRAAYDKAVAGRADRIDLDSTIYGKHRRSMTSREMVVGADTVEVKTQHVSVTPEGGGIRENLRQYNVVVGQFKTLFNATSMRERLVDAGYPEAFVVQTAEPYYYVVLASYASLSDASAARRRVADGSFPLPLREPLPFILQAVR